MSTAADTWGVILRICMGWFMFADGLKILLTPGWSASGFLLSAKTFPAFYAWFALPSNSWWVDPLNSWGITLIGVALIVGVGIRLASYAGAIMMLLYYFPHYVFPYVTYGYIVDDHIIYAVVFILIAVWPGAHAYSMAEMLRRSFVGKIPFVKSLI